MSDISIFGYRDLGTQVGQTLTYTSEGFYERGRLHKVYCRGIVETDLPSELVRTPIPFGRYIPSALWALSNYVYSDFEHRRYSENLLDALTTRYVKNDTADIHYYEYASFLRSLRLSNKIDKCTFLVGGTELRSSWLDRHVEELERLDLPVNVSSGERKQVKKRSQAVFEANYHIALSRFVKQSYVNAGVDSDRIRVVSQAVDPEQYPQKDTYESDEFNVLFVGSMKILKGIQYLLRAWELLDWEQDDGVTLRLCGNVTGEVAPILDKQEIQNLQLTGWVDPLSYYQNCSVFVFPSLSEGFSKATLEAMSTGTPVIVSEHSGTPDIISDGEEGFVVPIRDAKAIAEKLQYFRENPDEIERMGRQARKTAEQYTWGRFVDNTLEYIDEAVDFHE